MVYILIMLRKSIYELSYRRANTEDHGVELVSAQGNWILETLYLN